MKKIGYIYKYSETEKKGLLVWSEGYRYNGLYKKPFMFLKKDCKSTVKTGQLVYFELSADNSISQIERASLRNFDREFVNSIALCYDSQDWHDISTFTCVIYEDVRPIDLDVEKLLLTGEFEAIPLPDAIDDLYALFGKQKGEFDRDNEWGFKCVEITNIKYWVDKDVVKSKDYYGKTLEQVFDLFNIFVEKRRNAWIREERRNSWKRAVSYKVEDKSISSCWKFILSKLCHNDLKTVCKEIPLLQPAMPTTFCMSNLNLLSIEYGFPSIPVCESYYNYRIESVYTASDYRLLSSLINDALWNNTVHQKDEGIHLCKIRKSVLRKMLLLLESKFSENVLEYIRDGLSSLEIHHQEFNRWWADISTRSREDVLQIGIFMDKHNLIQRDLLHDFNISLVEDYLRAYNNLKDIDKEFLYIPIKNKVMTCVCAMANSEDKIRKASRLRYVLKSFSAFLDQDDIDKIRKIVNAQFCSLEDLVDLESAFSCEMISENQYLTRYKELTEGYNVGKLKEEIERYRYEEAPLSIQEYVIRRIYDKLNINIIGESLYDDINKEARSSFEFFFKWINDESHNNNIDENLVNQIEEDLISDLCKEDRWILFEKKIVQSPGIENIRKRLDEAYKKKSANKELFKYACFQDVMLSDLESIKDSELISFIADNIDSEHQDMLQQKAFGFLKLYLWQKQPSDDFDWNLIKTHFYELSANAQIRVLRFIFGKMASGESPLSLDDLYSEFVETKTPACSAICGILFMLKAKKNDMNVSITSPTLESVIGKQEDEPYTFLKDSRDLFYPCNGYLAISANKQDVDYQTFYGVLTKDVKNKELYYVIHFYNSPVDLFGRTIDWLVDSDYVETAKHVLLKNTNVEVIGDNYYVHKSFELFVKQFVIAYDIDDRCGLISDKERMMEQGVLPRYNAYQPLYTNYIRAYDDSDYHVCRCGSFGGSDPKNNIPFFWCNKKMCVRRAHFLLPPSKWENYRFADLLFIVLGQFPEVRESVWRVNSEISQFICDYKKVSNLNESSVCSKPLNEIEERGIWDESSSIYRQIYDDVDDDECEEDYDYYLPDHEEPTYDRYNGSYAQDEMGYSDDDIDTIFDGDPSAYWNID